MMEKLEYCEFMGAMESAPFDASKCSKCGGLGLIAQGCCSGWECGCGGRKTHYIECDCGSPVPTDVQLHSWLNSDDEYDEFPDEQ